MWALSLNPRYRIANATYADELALRNARAARNIVREHGDYLRIQLSEDSQAAGRWNTPQGGGLYGVGVGGSLTGFAANGVVIDDPHKDWVEALSETYRQRVKDWYRSVALSRLQKGGWIIVCQTRWHEDDLSGWLTAENPGLWETVVLPALAEPTDRVPDLLGRSTGEALCEDLHPRDELLGQMREAGPFLAAGIWQQRPAPAVGGILKRGWWQYWKQLPSLGRADEWLTSWDMSFKDGDDTDYVVGTVWVRFGADKYLVDIVRDRMSFVEAKEAVKQLAARYPRCRRHVIEEKANGAAIISELRHVVSGLEAWNPDEYGSKVARAHAVAGDIAAGNVWLPDAMLSIGTGATTGDIVNECASFPTGAHDDIVDSVSQALLRMKASNLVGTADVHDERRRGR